MELVIYSFSQFTSYLNFVSEKKMLLIKTMTKKYEPIK